MSRFTLHGAGRDNQPGPGEASAMVLNLTPELVGDLKRVATAPRLVTGPLPQLHIGDRVINLDVNPTIFHHELYSSTLAGSLSEFQWATRVSHRAYTMGTTAGSDTALAKLKQSLDSIRKEKQANQPNVLLGVKPLPSSRASTPTPRTAAEAKDKEVRMRAFRKVLVHLLALRPASADDLNSITHVPKPDLEEVLPKMSQREGVVWKLADRNYRDLDVWEFGYRSADDRQMAIDNAIRAYDRQRIPPDDAIWQRLLKPEERGKGIVLSRLASKVATGLKADGKSTPRPASSTSKTKPVVKPKAEAKPKAPAKAKAKAATEKPKAAEKPKASTPSKVAEKPKQQKPAEKVVGKPSPADRPKTPVMNKPKAESAKSRTPATHSSSDEEGEIREVPKSKARPDPAKSIASLAAKAKVLPGSARAATATPRPQSRTQCSPGNPHHPIVPSPLASARPRTASDCTKSSQSGIRPRNLTITSTSNTVASTTSPANSKRKAEVAKDVDPPSKRQRTDSTSPSPHASQSSESGAGQSTAHTSPNSETEVTFNKGVDLARQFRQDYPRYEALHDDQVRRAKLGETISREERADLVQLHTRLKKLKTQIYEASTREPPEHVAERMTW
ncbi:hypothetical protein K470DRAFT_160963 [Piedraia hortae CBS 480.64]|uniref:Uncharacterized protein n=1 Tax=Piedraia hortae CBS 480.64 TaxID=1314780 RepID=A0A6A7BSI1_9PEZI|nr:hypothetical protein K470DRAFT_160963 [Piedraia hortae CBS 480.64]